MAAMIIVALVCASVACLAFAAHCVALVHYGYRVTVEVEPAEADADAEEARVLESRHWPRAQPGEAEPVTADERVEAAARQIGWWRTAGPLPNGQQLAPMNDAYDWTGWEPVYRTAAAHITEGTQ